MHCYICFTGKHVTSLDDTIPSQNKKRCKQRHKSPSNNSKTAEKELELKPLLPHQLTNVRIRSYSEDISFPSLFLANNSTSHDGKKKNEQTHNDLKYSKGPRTVKTVIINL